MTHHTHISHLGLSEIKTTNTHIILGATTRGLVMRIGLFHGFDVRYETRNSRDVLTNLGMQDEKGSRAFVAKWTPEIWSIMIPLDVWNTVN